MKASSKHRESKQTKKEQMSWNARHLYVVVEVQAVELHEKYKHLTNNNYVQ